MKFNFEQTKILISLGWLLAMLVAGVDVSIQKSEDTISSVMITMDTGELFLTGLSTGVVYGLLSLPQIVAFASKMVSDKTDKNKE